MLYLMVIYYLFIYNTTHNGLYNFKTGTITTCFKLYCVATGRGLQKSCWSQSSFTSHFYNLNIYNNCCGFYKATTPSVAGSLVLKTAVTKKLFPTPVGKSYTCQSQVSVELWNGDVKATVFLQRFRLQPFISKSDFGPGKVFFPVL